MDKKINKNLNKKEVILLNNIYSKEEILDESIIKNFNINIQEKFGGKIKKFYFDIYSKSEFINKINNVSIISDLEREFIIESLEGVEKILKIDYIEVFNSYRKNGIGKEFLDFLKDFCKEMNINYINIDGYKKVAGFWEKVGFKLIKDDYIGKDDYYPGFLKIEKE